tara:strand:- start:2540 stop:2890 length:351 start_codon:yes stop_codon:yes gene_type:complete
MREETDPLVTDAEFCLFAVDDEVLDETCQLIARVPPEVFIYQFTPVPLRISPAEYRKPVFQAGAVYTVLSPLATERTLDEIVCAVSLNSIICGNMLSQACVVFIDADSPAFNTICN